MKKYILLFWVLFCVSSFAQSNQLWKGYFSYNEIKDMTQSGNTIFAASENALFSKNLSTDILKTTNTIDGLSGQTISAIYHSETFNRTLIGYRNGLIIVIKADGSMLNVVDIINKQIPPNIKKVNHFMEHDGIAYISCDFGIVQYDLAMLEFGDTYFIGAGVPEIVVSQTAVYNGDIYASTRDFGIRRANILNPNLVDATQWSQAISGNWAGVETFGSELTAVTTGGQLHRFNGSTFTSFGQLPGAAFDLRAADGYLIATSPTSVNVYNEALNIVMQFFNYQIPEMSASFTCGTVIDDTVFIGTTSNGVVTTEIGNPSMLGYISPGGPLKNNIFSINGSTDNLWAVYGAYQNYNPYPLDYLGFSKYTSADGWKYIPYDEVHLPGKQANDLVRVTVHPDNQDIIYVSSYHSGLLKFENDVLVQQYDHTNSGLESLVDPGSATERSVRIEQTAFDRAGNLWMTNNLIEESLKVLRPDESWGSYDMSSIVDGDFFTMSFLQMVVDKNNTKWMATYTKGVVAFNENGNVYKKITMGSESGNLPSANVRSLAIDKRNQLWIGTQTGLRVLPSVDRFLNDDQMTANAIIILDPEEDVAQELFYEQTITDIAVDGSNNKWVGTSDGGIFLVSPNGQETIYHFTIENSPLPSNSINDIDINGTTGEVFIATTKGLVSFKGISTNAKDDLTNVIVYPNPVRPEFFGTVKIAGLIDKANIKITDIEGNLVHETTSEGGTIEWDTTAFGKYRVASGVYMIFIAADDGVETAVKKVMIIR